MKRVASTVMRRSQLRSQADARSRGLPARRVELQNRSLPAVPAGPPAHVDQKVLQCYKWLIPIHKPSIILTFFSLNPLARPWPKPWQNLFHLVELCFSGTFFWMLSLSSALHAQSTKFCLSFKLVHYTYNLFESS